MHPVQTERDQVRQRIAARKGTVRKLREEIARDAARLLELDAQCQRLGLSVSMPSVGEEETHGH